MKIKTVLSLTLAVAMSTLAILVAHADSNTIEQRKILPYLEAEGDVAVELYKPALSWVSPERIIFNAC